MNLGIKDPGSQPFCQVMKRNNCRYGQGRCVSPGVGHFLHTFDQPLLVWHIGVADVLANGISLDNLIAFMNEPAGSKLFLEKGGLHTLAADSTMWIPYGIVATPIVFEDIMQRRPPADFAIKYLTFTFYSRAARDSLPENVWSGISSINAPYYQRKKLDELIGPVAALWTVSNAE